MRSEEVHSCSTARVQRRAGEHAVRVPGDRGAAKRPVALPCSCASSCALLLLMLCRGGSGITLGWFPPGVLCPTVGTADDLPRVWFFGLGVAVPVVAVLAGQPAFERRVGERLGWVDAQVIAEQQGELLREAPGPAHVDVGAAPSRGLA